MTTDQKEQAQWCIAREQRDLQQLEAGQWPDWAKYRERSETLSLGQRRMYADWCLKGVLQALLPILPKDLRAYVQACYDLRERIWSAEYLTAYYQAQEKASPVCLPASDSL